MRKRSLLTLLSLLCLTAHALQPDAVARLGLPVLTVTTINGEEPACDYVFPPEGAHGISIANATKVPGRCVLTLQDDTLFDSGPYEKDRSGMTLKIRGNTSAYYSLKKPYKLKLEKKNDLLTRGDSCYYDKNWVLLDNAGTSLNTLIGFMLNRLVGMPWTPAYEYVNLIVNGDYRGIYMLCEQVRRNADCRLYVDKHTGYILERDAYWWNEPLYFRTNTLDKEYTFKYPDQDDVTPAQLQFISTYMEQVEQSVASGTYLQYIDLPSWAAWLLAHDILGTSDSGGSNIYLALDNDSTARIAMTTLWDFGSIMRTTDQWARIHYDTWFYYPQLLDSRNRAFTEAYIALWNEKGKEIIDSLARQINDFAQSDVAAAIEASQPFEEQRWYYNPATVAENAQKASEWLSARSLWLDAQVMQLQQSLSVAHRGLSAPTSSGICYDLLGRRLQSPHGLHIKAGARRIAPAP